MRQRTFSGNLPAIKKPPSVSAIVSSTQRRLSPSRSASTRALPSLAIPVSTPEDLSASSTSLPEEASSSSCDYVPIPNGAGIPLMCCCCLDGIEYASGTCSSCSEEDSTALPLCAKCLQRHSQPDKFKKLRAHRYKSVRVTALEPLTALGISSANGLCSLHNSEPLRYFCREPSCSVSLCGLCVQSHRGHAFEELHVAVHTLRSSLVSRVFLSSCWPVGDSAASVSAPTTTSGTAPPSDVLDLVRSQHVHPVAEDELLDRMNFNSAARQALSEELAAASRAAAEAFDEASAVLATALEVGVISKLPCISLG